MLYFLPEVANLTWDQAGFNIYKLCTDREVGTLKELLIKIVITVIVTLAVWLPIAISHYRERKQFTNEFEKDFYILRQPKFVFGIGLVTTMLFFIAFVLAVFVSKERIGIFFIPFCVLGMALAIYSTRWKIIVMDQKLEIFNLKKSKIEVDILDIERVTQEHNGIIAYKDGKKLFGVENWVVGYELLYNRLHELGKMESTLLENSFRVRRSKAEFITGILCTICFVGILIWVIINADDTATPLVYAGFAGFVLLGIYLIVASLRWKLEVTGNILVFRTPLGREKSVSIRAIEKVIVKKNYVHLICNGKTIIKVEPVYKGFATLVERLQKEQISFYHKNKLIDFET